MKNPTPYDGEHVTESVALGTPIFTTASHVYVIAPVTRAAVQQVRVATMTKAYATVEDVQLRTLTHDSNIGHRSHAVAASGGVIHAAAGYNTTWADEASATNLAALAASTDPTGGATKISYYRYSVDPHTGDLYVTFRAGTTDLNRPTHIYRWNPGTSSWVLFSTIAGSGSLGGTLAFASDGTIYTAGGFAIPSTTGADSGFPRREGFLLKSTDDGATWQTMDGTTVTVPLQRPGRSDFFWPGQFNILHLAVDGNDNPVVLANYRNEDQPYFELWQATWDGTEMVHRKVLDHPAGSGVGDLFVAYHDGTIVVTIGEKDIVNDPVLGATPPYPVGKLWMLVTTDGGANWVRYQLHDADGTNGYSGAFLDPTSLAVDGVVRMLPMDLVTTNNHEVWELTLP